MVALKQEFQPINFDEKLMDEIKKRTQGPDESIGIYLAIMSAMFGRLTCSISETTQLKILLRNISPFYQNQLGLVEVTSVAHLRTLCSKLEERREAVEAFVSPSRRHELEPDLAYVGLEPVAPVTVSEIVPSPETSSRAHSIHCFNCRQLEHRAIGCGGPRVKKCYRCQKPGNTVRTCPDCNSTRNAQQRR